MNPRPDGTLDQGQIDLLEGIGSWLSQNGEAIYDTVPWKIFAEGHTEVLEYFQYHHDNNKPSRGIQPDPKRLDHTDVRFTRNGENLYATVLGVPPSGVVVIKSLSTATQLSDVNTIESVGLLGSDTKLEWTRTGDALEIKLPLKLPNAWALSFKIQVEGELDKSKPPYNEKLMTLPKQT